MSHLFKTFFIYLLLPSLVYADLIEIRLKAVEKQINVFETGPQTEVWTYEAELIKGPKSALTPNPSGFMGPTITVNKGDRVKVHFENNLRYPSIVHWHGLDVPMKDDGHPSLAIDSGESYQYDFKVINRAGLYWYHPHPHGMTGLQVYAGLAGLFIVHDKEEEKLKLPSGENEINLAISDKSFDENNQLSYMPHMMGMQGQNIFVNGELLYKENGDIKTITVRPEPYRLRILNASNARLLQLAWSENKPLTVIGNDGGLLEAPQTKDVLLLGAAERADIWADFSHYQDGDQVSIVSLTNEGGYLISQFKIQGTKLNKAELPQKLSTIERYQQTDAVNAKTPKIFTLGLDRQNGWTIDGLPYEMDKARAKETIKMGTMELWEFYNNTNMIHPMHVHGSQFQILSRTDQYASYQIDTGWKDTVLVFPGQRVRLLKRFDHFKGLFLYHCHILEHEDSSMMRNFKIE